MYLCYVDESGDPGLDSPTPHYILSGFIVHAAIWHPVLQALQEVRRRLKATFGFPVRAELKGSGLIDPRRLPAARREIYRSLGKRNVRVALYRQYMSALPKIHLRYKRVFTFSVAVDKEKVKAFYRQHDIIRMAWERFFDRYNTFLRHEHAYGMIIFDGEPQPRLRAILRRMRYYHPIPDGITYRQARVTHIVEDPFFVDSAHSFFVQTADMTAHAVYRFLYPHRYRRYRLHMLYEYLLTPPANMVIREVTRYNKYGIVHIPTTKNAPV